jgi:hypothetical protein
MKTLEEIKKLAEKYYPPYPDEIITDEIRALREGFIKGYRCQENIIEFDEDEIKEMACDFVINTGGLPKDLETWQEALWKFYKHTRNKDED